MPLDSADSVRDAPKAKGAGSKWASWGGTALGLLMLALAVWAFGKILRRYDLHEVIAQVVSMPGLRLAMALLFTGLSYLTQTGYDYLAARSLHRGASFARASFAAFIGNAFTNNIGLSLLTGTSLRYRFYQSWGVPPLEIAQLIGLSKLAFVNGLFVFSGAAQILFPVHLRASIHLPLPPRILGCLLLAPTLGLLIWNGLSKGDELVLGKFRLARPAQSLLIGQTALSCLHLAFAAFTLYYLLPDDALRAAGFAGPQAFLGAYMAIKFVAMFVPIPGNLGVFEGAAMAVLTPALPDYPVLGALLGYRIAYYVLPFALAFLMLAVYELSSRQGFLPTLLRRRRERKRVNVAV